MNLSRLIRNIPASGILLGALVTPNFLQAQEPPLFRVEVTEYVERATDAVNYRHRSGATKIDFAGTPLLPEASGEAKVESKQGYIEIEVEFDELAPASKYGPEFLTYVMWAVTPEGRATNLGEVILNGNRSKLNVTTELQAFGMVITAEPYYAVTMPSDVVVMENVIRDDTQGRVETVRAKYELLKRGVYANVVGSTRYNGENVPLELRQADNAVRIARASGAEQYAKDTFTRAVQSMSAAEGYHGRNEKDPARMRAREAIQFAEDARLIAVQKGEEARLAEERRLAEQKTAEANRIAAQEAQNRREAETQAQLATADRARAEAQARQAEQQAQQAAADRARAEAQARQSQQQAQQAAADAQRSAALKAEADAARLAAEAARTAASKEADRLAQERAAAEAAKSQALSAQAAAERDAKQARELAAKAEQERAELRARLQQQLNLVLETKMTARGLIVNMSDVLFDVDRATLKPGAREKLAKVAGILSTHPDLTIQVEGHTDSTGSDDYNQRLSEQRAGSARDFLVSQGIPASSINAKGLGESLPVASNDTATGRQQNRRVELVIAGDSIQASGNLSVPSANASAR